MEDVLQIWKKERLNGSEEFWHGWFAHRPELLAPTIRQRAFTMNSKCYVGGKAVSNRGGHVADFLAQHDGDVALIEIKTPTTRLLGKQYRNGVYAPSNELAGAVMQGLTYRLSLLTELHSLQSYTPGLTVHSPSIVVVIGDAEGEGISDAQRRSLQLFRTALKDVVIFTYDELFEGVANLAIWTENAF